MKKFGKVIIIVLLGLGIGLLVVGCRPKSNRAVLDQGLDKDWENEVLYAHDCGLDRLKCCLDKEPPCLYGQKCCTDPNNPKNNYCADSCECGQENNFCCLGNKCQEGLACFLGYCRPCGREDQPCCAREAACENNLYCYQNKCVPCGLPGNPCCEAGPACLDQDKRDESRTECYDNGLKKVCVYCGSAGKIACQADPACSPGNLFNNGMCYKCGNFNQPCCNVESGAGYECDPELNLECQAGFCAKIK